MFETVPLRSILFRSRFSYYPFSPPPSTITEAEAAVPVDQQSRCKSYPENPRGHATLCNSTHTKSRMHDNILQTEYFTLVFVQDFCSFHRAPVIFSLSEQNILINI